MNELLVRLIGGVVGTLGFVLAFEVKVKRIPASILGGLIGTAIYLLCDTLGMHAFVTNTVAAFVITIYSESAARILHSPALTFQIPGVIVLVPGSALYYTMRNLISGNFSEAGRFAMTTLQVGAGVADGIICGTVLFGLIKLIIEKLHSISSPRERKKRLKKKKNSKSVDAPSK